MRGKTPRRKDISAQSVDADLRKQALEQQEQRWLDENRDALISINSFIARHGLLASKLRFRA
jgi:post-segregation antitoxin (ccd killing protein)